jgi:hypothetical protein
VANVNAPDKTTKSERIVASRSFLSDEPKDNA